MWTEEVVLERRKPAAIRAIRKLLSEPRPHDIRDLFPSTDDDDALDSPKRLWQKRLLSMMSTNDWLGRQHNPAIGPPRYFVKSQRAIQEVLSDDESGGESLNDLILKSVAATPDDNSDIAYNPMPEEQDELVDDSDSDEPGGYATPEGANRIDPNSNQARRNIIEFIGDKNVVTTHEIAEHALGFDAVTTTTYVMQRIGAVLRELGWQKGQSRGTYGEKPKRIWTRPGHDADTEEDEVLQAPAPVAPAPLVDPIPGGASDVVSLLKSLGEAVAYSVDLQNKLAENLIYMRDKGDETHARVESIEARLDALEARGIPNDALVNSIRVVVREVMEESSARSGLAAAGSIVAATSKLSTEIKSLCEAARAIAAGVKDE